MRKLYYLLAFFSLLFGVKVANAQGYTFVVDDQNHIGQFTTQWFNPVYEFEDNKVVVDALPTSDMVLYAADGYEIVRVTEGSFTGTELATSSIGSSGGVIIDMTSEGAETPALTPGATYYITTGTATQRAYGWIFTGPEGLRVYYGSQNRSYEYDNGKYVVDDIATYGNIQVSIDGNYTKTLELVSVTDENGRVYTPENGVVTIFPEQYIKDGSVMPMNFTVLTKEAAPKATALLNVEVRGGQAYWQTMSIGNTAIDFYNGLVQNNIEFDPNTDILQIDFMNPQWQPYSVTIGGQKVEPIEFNQGSQIYLEPGDAGYPADGNTIVIDYVNPTPDSYTISFDFKNDGTQKFISQFRIGPGEFADPSTYESGSVTVSGGTQIEIYFNTVDFRVNSVTLNNSPLSLANGSYFNSGVREDLNFVFDVTPIAGNTVNVVAENWQHVLVDDPDQNVYELTGTTTVLTLPRSVDMLRFKAMDGYEIKEGNVTVTVNGNSQNYNQGDGITVVNGMTVTVNCTEIAEPTAMVWTFVCEEDVLEFTGGTADILNPDRQEVALTVNYADGAYTVTPIPAYLTITVKEDSQEEFQISSITCPQIGSIMSYDGGKSVQFNTLRFSGDYTLTVNFQVPPIPVTFTTNNAAYISRIYGENAGNITTFPYTYNLNDGRNLTIEAKGDALVEKIVSTSEEGVQTVIFDGTPVSELQFSLEGVEENAVVNFTLSVPKGDIQYIFYGPEGIDINYNGTLAAYTPGVSEGQGMYILDNILSSSLGYYNITVSVNPAFNSKVKLLKVHLEGTAEEDGWEAAGVEGVIYMGASSLPRQNAVFDIITETPELSETTRTVYLTIDQPVIGRAFVRGGSYAYITFDAENKASVTIDPSSFEIEVELVPGNMIRQITTDVEGTFVIPELPRASVVLDLSNCVEGQTINFLTKETGVQSIEAVFGEGAEVYTLQGVRVRNVEGLAPGIYIVNGKKVVVRK